MVYRLISHLSQSSIRAGFLLYALALAVCVQELLLPLATGQFPAPITLCTVLGFVAVLNLAGLHVQAGGKRSPVTGIALAVFLAQHAMLGLKLHSHPHWDALAVSNTLLSAAQLVGSLICAGALAFFLWKRSTLPVHQRQQTLAARHPAVLGLAAVACAVLLFGFVRVLAVRTHLPSEDVVEAGSPVLWLLLIAIWDFGVALHATLARICRP